MSKNFSSKRKKNNNQKKKKNYLVAGIDEVGRGTLTGPVVACALVSLSPGGKIIFDLKIKNPILKIKNPKQLTHTKREKIFHILKNEPLVEWGIGRVSEKVIDKINIFESTKLAMERAVINLEKKIRKNVDFLIID